MAGDGEIRDRFTEGEPMTLEVWLYSEEGIDGARVTVGIRDGGGTPVGSQTVEDVRLRPERLELLRLHFPGLPMREGRFFVDVGVAAARPPRAGARGARARAERLRPGRSRARDRSGSAARGSCRTPLWTRRRRRRAQARPVARLRS